MGIKMEERVMMIIMIMETVATRLCRRRFIPSLKKVDDGRIWTM